MQRIDFLTYTALLNKAIESNPLIAANCEPPKDLSSNIYLKSPCGISYVNVLTGYMGGLCKISTAIPEKTAEIHQNFRVSLGGNNLNCYDGKLVEMYKKNGFEVVERSPFDEQYAPENWQETLSHKPDYVIMKLKQL